MTDKTASADALRRAGPKTSAAAARAKAKRPAKLNPEAKPKPAARAAKKRTGKAAAKVKAVAEAAATTLKSEAPPAKKKTAARLTEAQPKALVARIYATIDGELTKLENQEGQKSQDRERASRALSQMVNSLEKAIDMQREMTKTKQNKGSVKDKEALAHAEDLRKEIAERIERLRVQRASGK